MIEGFVSTVVQALILQGGGWLIAVLLGVVIFIMDRRAFEAKTKHEKDIQAQYDKRLGEFRELLEVVQTSTQTITTMQRSVSTSGESINQLTQAFAHLLRELDSRNTRWADKGDTFGRQLEDIQRRLESLQKGRAS